jgi:hypothetical protein
MLCGVKGDDANRVVELPRNQIADDGFEVRPLGVGFAVSGAKPAKVVDYQIDGLTRAVGHDWHDRRGPVCSRHTQLLQTQTQRRGKNKTGGFVPVEKCVNLLVRSTGTFPKPQHFDILM